MSPFMRHPWQIWLAYIVCLAVALPALAWLTQQTLEADRAEHQARLLAEQEEVVSNVLWQMDTELSTLLAQEAARPYFVYSSFYPVENALPQANAKAPSTPDEREWTTIPSPLLLQPAPYVLLHFQIDARGEIRSPQTPQGKDRQRALDGIVQPAQWQRSQQRLLELKQKLSFAELLAALPDERMPEITVAQWPDASNNDAIANNESQRVGNTLGYESVAQQLQVEQNANPSPPQQTGANPGSYLANNLRSPTRVGADLQQRNRAYQTAAQRQFLEQRLSYAAAPQWKVISEGLSQPVWLEGQLYLARRIQMGDQELVQGCWLDWPTLKQDLLTRFAADLPLAQLEPVSRDTDRSQIKVSRLLATVPAQLAFEDATASVPWRWTPLRTALAVAWGMLALAAGAVGLLLQGVITLSERRGAFVSAVTHELRTPLTTFRMYAEMLAENMIPNPETRQRYLETLRVEADRLSHLVENVLSYARLERGRNVRRRETISLSCMLEAGQARFADRAAQAEMKLIVDGDDAQAIVVNTDPQAVEQILFNLIDNACKYAAGARDARIHLEAGTREPWAVLRVRDHGPGIEAAMARRLFRPFSKSVHEAAHSAPGVGLGLALSRRLARALGGRLKYEAQGDSGACFVLYLPLHTGTQ